MSAIFNSKNLSPTIYVNGHKIKYIGYNGKLILNQTYKLTDLSKILSIGTITNTTDNTTANSKSVVSYAVIIDETNKTITINNLSIAATFFVSVAGTKTINIKLSVANEYINVNGTFELTFSFETYLTQGENVPIPLLIDELTFTFLESNKFYDVVDLVSTWVN